MKVFCCNATFNLYTHYITYYLLSIGMTSLGYALQSG
jgi:hypothetical protein